MDTKRTLISGTAMTVRGNDIDTDRIIPARFLTSIVFEGLGAHVFADDRRLKLGQGKIHPFDEPSFAGAELLLVNKNFGCGSSREHAPQALMRWGKGIKAVVGESFAEIFFANCLALGIPCATVDEASMRLLMAANEADPRAQVRLDLEQATIRLGERSLSVHIPEGARQALLSGGWDTTAELLSAEESIARTGAGLPYWDHWTEPPDSTG
jgi:3-isopropylmalate/(R)-2-methylmalate dehydratase small subunit